MKQLELNFCPSDQTLFDDICDCIGCDNSSPGWPDSFGKLIRQWLSETAVKPIKTLSLFSGAGGLDIGFSDIGFQIVSSVEIEEKFCETLQLNAGKGKRFSETSVHCVDIKDFSGDNLTDIDFIIGGPPCQSFSAAGRRANGVMGIEDERGTLFREYVRLLKKLSPKGFLFENVYGITGAQDGRAWHEILTAFTEVGYKLSYRVIDAADYGVPQHRERLIIVGLKDSFFQFPRPTHGPDSVGSIPFYNAGTALEGVVSAESDESNQLGGRYAHLLEDIPPGLNYSFYTEEMGHPSPLFAWRSKFSDFLYKADPAEPVRTIKASGGAYTGPLHWENRFFNCEEYKRLQTFPDDYLISGSKQTAVKQIGNSVPPQLARIMAVAIREQVFGTSFPFRLSRLGENEELSFRKRKRELSALYKKKAQEALQQRKESSSFLPASRQYHCTIDSKFKFEEKDRRQGDFKVSVRWGDMLRIDVKKAGEASHPVRARIHITPRQNVWPLSVQEVQLVIHAELYPGLTVAWKALERELVRNSLKADLVQLNGYYQYPPRIQCDIRINGAEKYATVLRKVINNASVPQMKSGTQLAEEWGISCSEIIDAAQYLRLLGYEIRNHRTNPQIEENMWLIPYAFPTLTPQSVQLSKKLH